VIVFVLWKLGLGSLVEAKVDVRRKEERRVYVKDMRMRPDYINTISFPKKSGTVHVYVTPTISRIVGPFVALATFFPTIAGRRGAKFQKKHQLFLISLNCLLAKLA
jgi:hypothetical protein